MAKNMVTGKYDRQLDEEGRTIYPSDRIRVEARGDFELGQDYETEPCKTAVCKGCGGDRFIVGAGHCLTVLKCPTCNYEVAWHDG